MPLSLYAVNRYKSDDPVVGAAVTFNHAAITPDTPRTAANGFVTVSTDGLLDGNQFLRVTPAHTSKFQPGPEVAEGLPQSVTRVFRTLEVGVTVQRGRVVAAFPLAGQEDNGEVGAGTNPVRALLQPLYYRGIYQIPNARKHDQITAVVIHHTSSGTNVEGTLSWFNNTKQVTGSAHYLVSAEERPQVIKIVQDTGLAGHTAPNAADSWWAGQNNVDKFSIGIEMSHVTGTPWPPAQISALMGLLMRLMGAYPSIKPHRIVGHSDVLVFARDCPGMDFDWATLEKFGYGMIPRTASLDTAKAYGGFFQHRPDGQLRQGDDDSKRIWGGDKTWAAPPGAGGAPGSSPTANQATLTGQPIRELQTDLRDIGYYTSVDGVFDSKTQHAVEVFQKHFFAGSRRGEIKDAVRKRVDRVTAQYIKNVRPVDSVGP